LPFLLLDTQVLIEALDARGRVEYRVDKGKLQVQATGISYRNSTDMNDKSGAIAHWGQSVKGKMITSDDGLLWLEVKVKSKAEERQGASLLMSALGIEAFGSTEKLLLMRVYFAAWNEYHSLSRHQKRQRDYRELDIVLGEKDDGLPDYLHLAQDSGDLGANVNGVGITKVANLSNQTNLLFESGASCSLASE